jgi:L-rhamnose mutarotase
MIRKAFAMSVNAGCEEEYERRHQPVWEELAQVLQAHGVHNYSIFLHPETRQLFGYAEIESEERWAAIAETHMRDVMPANEDASPVSTGLREIFHMD